MQNRLYNLGHPQDARTSPMPKQNHDQLTDFGKRFSTLRKKAGYTQTELAEALGVTQRMISYYEGHSEFPPANMLPKMATLLGVTTDELLGVKPLKAARQPDSRLLRRMQQIDKLSTAKKRQIMQMIDMAVEHEKLTK
jgi:transcriptional regulator with XRE-family HTH domain